MPVRSRSGAPASLYTRTKSVTPRRRAAVTRNAPCVRKFRTAASDQLLGTAGNIRITPPQLWHSMSWMLCAPDSGVSMTGPDSRYIVLGCTNRRSSSPR